MRVAIRTMSNVDHSELRSSPFILNSMCQGDLTECSMVAVVWHSQELCIVLNKNQTDQI